MSKPLVTIGIPTHNRVALLERAVRSALAQSGVELEVIVSDNASVDGTTELCSALALRDPRLRIIRQPTNIGGEANFQAVLDHATSPFFMWLADDDWIDPGYVARCVRELLERPDHLLIGGQGVYYRNGRRAFSERPMTVRSRSPAVRVLRYYSTVTLNGVYYGVGRREELARLPVRAEVGSDWLHVAALAARGKLATVSEVSIHRAIEGASQDASTLGRRYGLSRRQARHWYLLVALAAREGIRRDSTFEHTSSVAQTLLGAAAATIIVLRFGPKAWTASLLARLGALDGARSALERRRRA